MRSLGLISATSLFVSACGGGSDPAADSPVTGNGGTAASTSGDPTSATQPVSAARWDLQSSGEGASLALLAARAPGRRAASLGARRLPEAVADHDDVTGERVVIEVADAQLGDDRQVALEHLAGRLPGGPPPTARR